MTTLAVPAPVAFGGIRGRVLAWLLQFGFVRYHRVQLGFVEHPDQYRRFLAEVIGPRLLAIDGRLGVFGTGVHTEVALQAIPELAERIHCFTDNNPALWHQTRFGKRVLPPRDAVRECDGMFLSTAVFQRVLERDLQNHGFQGAVVAMDDVVPAAWFLR